MNFNTTYQDDRRSELYIEDVIKGYSYSFIFDDIIINVRDNQILNDFQVSYEHEGNTFICEYTIDIPSVIHYYNDEQIDVVKHGTNIYSGSYLTKGKTYSTLFKGKRCFAVSVIPTPEYLKEIVEKEYEFSNIIYDEICGNTKNITIKRNLVNTELSKPILNIVDSIANDNIITELIEAWGKEYFFKLMQICIKPQSDFERIQEIIKMNISNKLTLEIASRELGISKRTLNKIFSENNLTFKEYKKSILQEKAKDMVAQGYALSEISKKLKFSSLSYFKKSIGISFTK